MNFTWEGIVRSGNFVACLISLAMALAVSAEEKPAGGSDTAAIFELDTITVTATRTSTPLQRCTGALTVVGADNLKTMARGIAADEAIGMVPGVRVENQADGERLHMSIRGQGILSEHGLRGIKVMLDGIPLNDPTGFVSDLYDVDWETVNRIEVLRGPAAALYGCASNAGVLNVSTQAGGSRPFDVLFRQSVGSNGFWKTLGQVNGSADKSDYRLSYSHTQGYGSRVHQGYYGDVASFKDVWKPSSIITLTPILSYSNYFNQNSEGINDSLAHSDPTSPNSDAIPFNEYMKTTKLTGGGLAKVSIAENQSINISGFMRSTRYKESNNHYVDYRSIMTPGGSAQYNWDAKGSRVVNHISVGADVEFQNIDESQLPHLHDTTRTESKGNFSEDVIIPNDQPVQAAQTVKQSGIGAFLQEQLDIGRVSLVGNLRYDNIRNKLTDLMRPSDSVTIPGALSGEADFDKVTGRVGASLSLAQLFNLYANWGMGFLPPATEELESNPARYGGFNKNLKPSESMGGELGARGSYGERLSYEFTGYLMNTQNDFMRYRLTHSVDDSTQDRSQETFYGNAGNSRRIGAEFFVAASPVKPLSVQLSYTYSNFVYTSTAAATDSLEKLSLPRKNQWLPNCPRHQLEAEIDGRFLRYFTIQGSAHYQSLWFLYTDPKNAWIHENGFALFNARLGYDWKIGPLSGELSFSVKNIADKLWIAFTEPDLDNGKPNNSYQPGPGREFFGSLSVKF